MCSSHYQTEFLMEGHAQYVANVSHVNRGKTRMARKYVVNARHKAA